MKLSQDQLDAFRTFSYDENPLHVQPDFARRTSFGKPVFYGIATVLAAISNWANGRTLSLAKLHAEFKRPIQLGKEYDLECTQEGNSVELRARLQGRIALILSFEFELPGQDFSTPRGRNFDPLKRAKNIVPVTTELAGVEYFPDSSKLEDLCAEFQLRPGQLPANQLAFLCWASYFTGMEWPGERALLYSVQVDFCQTEASLGFLSEGLNLEFDTRFQLLTTSGAGSGVKEFKVGAFMLPEVGEVTVSDRDIPALRDLNVLVLGASRGLGRGLALTAAANGAKTSAILRREATDSPGPITQVVHDLSINPFKDMPNQKDIVLANAFPPAHWLYFAEQSNDDIIEYLTRTMVITLNSIRTAMTSLKKGGLFVLVSSAAVSEPPPDKFSSYLAAKSAAEGVVRGLAVEERDYRFVILRPNRFKSGLTAQAGGADDIPEAGEMAARALRAATKAKSHFEIIPI